MTEHSRAMIQPKEDFKGTEGESKAIAHKYRIARPRSSDRKDSRRMISWRIALGLYRFDRDKLLGLRSQLQHDFTTEYVRLLPSAFNKTER